MFNNRELVLVHFENDEPIKTTVRDLKQKIIRKEFKIDEIVKVYRPKRNKNYKPIYKPTKGFRFEPTKD